MTPTDDSSAYPREGGESSALFTIAIAIGEEKWRILGFDFLLTLLVLLASLLIPNTFTAKSLLLPPQQGQSGAGSALAALGVISMGLGSAANLKSPEELYVAMLKSESITDALIERFKLKDRYDETTLIETRKELARHVVITADRKSGLIRVEAEDHDPVFAASLANAYSEELRRLMDRIAVTEASQRRIFFEQQAEHAKEVLAKAEMAFKAAQQKYGFTSIDVSAQGDIRAAAELRAQMMTREVQVQAMRSFSGPENADVQRLNAEIGSLRAQLAKVEHGRNTDDASSEAALANQRVYRELKYQEALLAGLITQTELARGDEARQAPLIQQVDVARPPDRKSAPKRGLIALVTAVSGLLLGVYFVLVRRRWSSQIDERGVDRRWQRLVAAWKFKSGMSADRSRDAA